MQENFIKNHKFKIKTAISGRQNEILSIQVNNKTKPFVF